MPNKDGTGNVKDGLKRVGIVFLAMLIIALVGSSSSPKWLYLVAPLMTGGAAYFVSRNPKAIAFWTVLGLIGAIAWVASV